MPPRGVARFRAYSSLFALLASFGCASTGEHPQRQLDQAFAQIQVHEASVEYNFTRVNRGQHDCRQTCEDSGAGQRSGRALCELAERIGDADARLRCARAKTTTDATAMKAANRCQCLPPD
jgi:hypothetical protein